MWQIIKLLCKLASLAILVSFILFCTLLSVVACCYLLSCGVLLVGFYFCTWFAVYFVENILVLLCILVNDVQNTLFLAVFTILIRQ